MQSLASLAIRDFITGSLLNALIYEDMGHQESGFYLVLYANCGQPMAH